MLQRTILMLFLLQLRWDNLNISLIDVNMLSKSIHIRECYSILFYHFKKSLYQLYITIFQYTQHPNFYFSILLIKILYLHHKIYFFLFCFFPIFSSTCLYLLESSITLLFTFFQTPPPSSISTQLLHHPYQPRSVKQERKKKQPINTHADHNATATTTLQAP